MNLRLRPYNEAMRQLSIAAFLFVIGAIGVYWMVAGLSLHSFYPDTTVQFPNNLQPRTLPSITPGPSLGKLAGFSQTPQPKLSPAVTEGHSIPRFVGHVEPVKPIPIAAPTAPTVTPMPAPTYAPVTPFPFAHTPPPIVPVTYPTVGAPVMPTATVPSASPSPSAN